MAEQFGPPSFEEFVKQKIALRQKSLEDSLRLKCVGAPKYIEEIVNWVLKLPKPDSELYEKPVRLFAESMKDASVYKKRAVASRIATVNLTTKIIIIQQLLEVGIKSFPMDLCLSKDNRRGDITDSIMKFEKPRSPQAMAFGLNKYGRLGIGSKTERVDELTPVELYVDIAHVFMGPNHTIFQTKTGELYGCGIQSNFLDGAQDSKENAITPTKIEYFHGDPLLTPNIILGETYTKIMDFNQNSSLIVGTDITVEPENKRSTGDNYMFVNKPTREENQEIIERQIKEIKVDEHKKPRRKIKVRNDCLWVCKNGEKLDIVFVVDGYRVDSEKLWKNYTVCTNGKVYAIIDNNIYKGRFIILPRTKTNEEFNDRLSGDEDDEDQVVEGDFHLVKRDGILLCILEEIVLPYAFDGLTVSDDGESFIAWSDHPESAYPNFKKYRVYEDTGPLKLSLRPTQRVVYDAVYLLESYEKIVETDIKRMKKFYLDSGHPKYKSLLRGLKAIIHFLRVDKNTELPEVLVNNINENNTLNLQGVEKELQFAIQQASKLQVLVTKSETGSKIKEENEISSACLQYYLELNNEATQLIKNLGTMPLKYRGNRLESTFGVFVERIIRSINLIDVDTIPGTNGYGYPPTRAFKRNHCRDTLDKKTEAEEAELNLKLIRVEAAPIIQPDRSVDTIAPHHIYQILTTEFHIKCIDASLLKHVNKEFLVLNLNQVCFNDPSHNRFQELLDSFFLIRDSFCDLATIDRVLHFESATESLKEADVYSIKTSDNETVRVPKYLFELYSEYDSSRKKYVEDPNAQNTFSLECSGKALRLLVNCLIDVRIFFRANMKLKMEVFELAKYLLMRHIWKELRMMIVQTVEEKDLDYIEDLLEQADERVDIMYLIGEYRPEIILFWKKFPNKDYLSVIQRIASDLKDTRYRKIEAETGNVKLPIVAMRDTLVDKDKIPAPILKRYLCNESDDDSVTDECARTAFKWNDENTRKRRHEDRNPYMPGARPVY